MAGHRVASWVRLQIRVRVFLRIFRRSVVAEAPNVSDLAPRHRRAQAHMSVASRNNDHNPRFASQSRRHLPACLRVKQAAREKEGKVLTVNLAGHHQEVERLRRLSVRRDSPKVSRKASPRDRGNRRDRDNHSAARKRAREAHRRQARSNFLLPFDLRLRNESSGAAFSPSAACCSVRCPQRTRHSPRA